MQALLIVTVTCHVSCVTVTACHTLAWVGEIPPPIDDLSRATGRSVFSILCYAMLLPKPDSALYSMLGPECKEWCVWEQSGVF